MRFTAALCGLFVVASSASASPDTEDRARYLRAVERGLAEARFAQTAHDWYTGASQRADASRSAPQLRADATGHVTATYRLVAPGFETELRPTGVDEAPYVGVVHYREWVYRCRDASADTCSVTHASPRAALFRYRDGRWDY